MKLDKKKQLAARTLNVGKERIIFNTARLEEIKEAITKQDIRDLMNDKSIAIKEIKGRRKLSKRKTRRRIGSRKKTLRNKKQVYVKLTRKLRRFLFNLKIKRIISKEKFLGLRKEIRSSSFKSLAQLKERIKQEDANRKWNCLKEEN